jgi:hypothetical protein
VAAGLLFSSDALVHGGGRPGRGAPPRHRPDRARDGPRRPGESERELSRAAAESAEWQRAAAVEIEERERAARAAAATEVARSQELDADRSMSAFDAALREVGGTVDDAGDEIGRALAVVAGESRIWRRRPRPRRRGSRPPSRT